MSVRAHGRQAWAAAALVAGMACAPSGEQRAAASGASASPPPATAAPPETAAAEPARLVALWMRTDSPYVLSIESATPEGRLLARYLNPRPINVSRAEWKRDSGRLALLVELNDRGYPGSYYELKFDPGSDTLYGVYHHLGLGQDFDVSFTRQAPSQGGGGR
jgi:hypothetical protein